MPEPSDLEGRPAVPPDLPSAPPRSTADGAAPASSTQAEAKRRRKIWLSYGTTAVLLIIISVMWLVAGPSGGDTTSDFFAGMALALIGVWGLAWWIGRRGGSSYSRAFNKTQDERDKAIWRSA